MVDVKVINDVIERFVVDKPQTCDEFVAAAGNETYVLYNVNCRDGENNETGPHHYYWPKK